MWSRWFPLALFLFAIHPVLVFASHAPPPVHGIAAMDVYTDPERGDVIDVLLVESAPPGASKFIHLRSRDGGATWPHRLKFQPPEPIFAPHRGNDPQIAAHGDTLVILWTQPGSSRFGSGPIGAMRSLDAGKTWKRITTPSDTGSTEGHAYADLAADSKGNFHAVWLDSRDQKQGLRYAKLSAGTQRWSKNQTLDARTCECCMNRIYADGDRISVLYRDTEPRDMALAVSESGGKSWRREGAVGVFQWDFQGCPHVGGAMDLAPASASSALDLALVWTGHEEKAGLYLLRSERPQGKDARSWQVLEKQGAAARWFDIARNRNGQLAYVWGEMNENLGAVYVRQSSDGGRSWQGPVRISPQGQSAQAPVITAAGNGFLVSWIEVQKGQPQKWRSEILPELPTTTSALRE